MKAILIEQPNTLSTTPRASAIGRSLAPASLLIFALVGCLVPTQGRASEGGGDPGTGVEATTLTLTLADLNSYNDNMKSDSTDDTGDTPVLYCIGANDDDYGDVKFWLDVDSGSYDWNIIRDGVGIDSGTLCVHEDEPGYNYAGWSYDCIQAPVSGPSTLVVTNADDLTFCRQIQFAVVHMNFIRQKDNEEFPSTENGACHMVSKFTTTANYPGCGDFNGPPISPTGDGYGKDLAPVYELFQACFGGS
jgi:hypothetical protein